MKKVKFEPKETEIDWNKKQWVQHVSTPDMIVATAGKTDGEDFEGYCLPCNDYPNGNYCEYWDKKQFKPLTTTIPFEISNDND